MKAASSWKTSSWRGDLIAFAAGILLPLSLAPYGKWGLGILSASVFAGLLRNVNPQKGVFRSFVFGLGMFGGGTSWVYVSIHDFGNAPLPLAFAMTVIFVSFLALVFSLPFYFYCRYLSRNTLGYILGFPSIWILGEWIRSWFLTGFPWLYLGYGHVDTPLAGWAPIVGVFGVGWLAIVTGNLIAELVYLFEKKLAGKQGFSLSARSIILVSCASLLFIWGGGSLLNKVEWVTNEGKTVQVAIVQPNIPLEVKWQPIYRPYIMDSLRELSETAWQADLVVWPEAAIPMLYNEASEFLYELTEKANETHTALVTGILYDDTVHQKYFNAIMGLGHAENIYFKQRLVPFGEYVPLEHYLRGLIDFFDLPNSIIHAGPKNQTHLKTDSYKIASYICYEVVYPDLVVKNLSDAAVIITISNDAWFGDSIGPLQHFQMAQMRAIENGRYLIRATNTGLSAVISHKGQVVKQGKQFIQQSINSEIELMKGKTPFSIFGSVPIILLCVILCIANPLIRRDPQS